MGKSAIEWCTDVWNPVTGCAKVSQGCKHCYAETVANRFWGTQYPVLCRSCGGNGLGKDGVVGTFCMECGGYGETGRKFTDVRCHPERLDQPLRWRKPRRVFVNSMSDLFHEDVPDDFIADVFGVMSACIALGTHATRGHTFQILTKRPERMLSFMSETDPHDIAAAAARYGGGIDPDGIYDQAVQLWPVLPNVWLGVSAEDQDTFDDRVPVLLDTPAAVRFVSLEPMLGPIDCARFVFCPNCGCSEDLCPRCTGIGRDNTGATLDWVIVGGESGPGARPFDVQWARDIIAQCRAAGVPCFIKQLGALPHQSNPPNVHGQFRSRAALGIKHPKGGDPDEWPADLRVRQMPGVA